MRIIITGASGFLGRKAMKILSQKNEIIGVDKKGSEGVIELNLEDIAKLWDIIDKFNPEAILNLAAIMDLDICESDKLQAMKINVEVPLYLSDACRSNKIKFVTFSSDYVFSGEDKFYYEDSEPKPKNFYGLTKKAMESLVLYSWPESIIIRPSIMYGFGQKDRVVMPIIESIEKGIPLYLDDFRLKYPVLIDEVIENVTKLLKKNSRGIYHFSSHKGLTRFKMAEIVSEVFSLDKSLIRRGGGGEKVDRPYNVKLINTREPGIVFSNFLDGTRIIKKQREQHEDY